MAALIMTWARPFSLLEKNKVVCQCGTVVQANSMLEWRHGRYKEEGATEDGCGSSGYYHPHSQQVITLATKALRRFIVDAKLQSTKKPDPLTTIFRKRVANLGECLLIKRPSKAFISTTLGFSRFAGVTASDLADLVAVFQLLGYNVTNNNLGEWISQAVDSEDIWQLVGSSNASWQKRV